MSEVAEGMDDVDADIGTDDGFSSGGTDGLENSGGMDNPEGFDPPTGEPIDDEEVEEIPEASDPDDDEAVEAQDPDPDAESPAAEAVQPYTPYAFKVGNGPDVAVPGVYKNPADGSLYVHPDAVEGLNRAIHESRLREQDKKENYQLKRQLQTATTKVNEDAVRNKNTALFWENLAKDKQKLWDFINEYEVNKPQLDAANEKAIAQAYYQAGQQLRAPDPQQAQQQVQADQDATIRQVVGQSMHQFKTLGLSENDWEELGEWLDENRTSLFIRANKDHVAENPRIKEGQWVYNDRWTDKAIQRFIAWKGKTQQAAASVAQAQSYNAKRAGQTGAKKAPPALSNRPPQRTAPKERTFKSRREWQDYLLRQDDGDQIRTASA